MEIIIADDHPVFSDGLRQLVTRSLGICSIRMADRHEQVLKQAREKPPDLFILDLDYPGFGFPSALTALRMEFPETSILVISMFDDPTTVDKVLENGADGFVSKALPPQQISNAIRNVLNGEIVRQGSGDTAPLSGDETGPAPLTKRQQEILQLLTIGRSNKEIARELDISPNTVRLHVSSLLKSLNASNRAAAAAIGRDLGY